MSGGVDSSVSAALLKEQGFSVAGVFIRTWNSPEHLKSEKMAQLVAKKIGIPFYIINAKKEFKKKVVDYFLNEYKSGRTPNPCVVCNKEIKFGLLIEKALKMGADYVATGHYARRQSSASVRPPARTHSGFGNFSPSANRAKLPAGYASDLPPRLFKGKDKEKDQSYFLWQLNQKQLSRVLFPVGNYTKPEVRKLAKKFNLPSAKKKKSQEVCFINETTNNFLKRYLKLKPGNIIDKNKKIIGKHQGLWLYTIGQRKGIGLGGGPYYVVEKDFKSNNLIVSTNKNDLLKKELSAESINWISGKKPKVFTKLKAKIRYRSKESQILSVFGKKILFKSPQPAITPGQSVVFYDKNELVGGGIIK